MFCSCQIRILCWVVGKRCWQGAGRGVGRKRGSPKCFASLELESILGASVPRLEFIWSSCWSQSSKMAEFTCILDCQSECEAPTIFEKTVPEFQQYSYSESICLEIKLVLNQCSTAQMDRDFRCKWPDPSWLWFREVSKGGRKHVYGTCAEHTLGLYSGTLTFCTFGCLPLI